MPLPLVDTRPFFRPLTADIVALLRGLDDPEWLRPTVAGSWRVRDVVAHLSDTALRRLSVHRDANRASTPDPSSTLVAFINRLNASWVDVAQRFSPRVLTDLYELAGGQLAAFIEGVPLDGPAVFAVSWAGESESVQWLDIGRDFTEVWHHGSQIRDAVGAGPFADPEWLRAVLQIALHAVPHAYRRVTASGRSIAIGITGPAGGEWVLQCGNSGSWDISEGRDAGAAAVLTMSDETAWRVLFNALSPAAATAAVRVDGDRTLAAPFLAARSVIV